MRLICIYCNIRLLYGKRLIIAIYLYSILGHFHLIWTDYISSALLYECYRVEDDQRCSPGADHITMLSRTHNMSQTVYDMMVEKAEQLCFTEERIGEMKEINQLLLG